jgi:hypothetical protein
MFGIVFLLVVAGCSTSKPVKTCLSCHLAAYKGGEVIFSLTNISSEKLAVSTLMLPNSDPESGKHVFRVIQSGKKVPFRGAIVEPADTNSETLILRPGEVYKVNVPIRSLYRVEAEIPFSVEYATVMDFDIVNKGRRKAWSKDLRFVTYMKSNELKVER